MNWLIWKEYRLNRLIVIVGLLLLVVPHALAAIIAWCDPAGPRAFDVRNWSEVFVGSALYSLVVSQLTLALLGGNAIACERIDRSAEFLAYLPVSKVRILAAKMVLPLTFFALIWISNLLILWMIWPAGEALRGKDDFATPLWIMAGVGMVFFSVGWLLSSILESPTFSICGGLITPFLVVVGLGCVAYLLIRIHAWDPVLDEFAAWYYPAICVTLAVASFVVGTIYYLRRVEP
jgi:ABC-type transport system involved in multi-copper enzyme maturation permease subunit